MTSVRHTAITIALCSLALAGWAWAGIEGSKHDFTHESWSDGDACGACHTPHTPEPPQAAPLWDADADLNRTFGTSLSGDARPGNGTLICIRCHDGTIARDTISGQAKERFRHKQHPGLFHSGHQTSDHPVGIEYPDFDDQFHPASTVTAKGAVALPDGRVECISCHDPHNHAGEKLMLVISNARSALCLTCHKK